MAKIALDVHVHLIPTQYLAGAEGIQWDPAACALSVDGKPVGLKPLFQPSHLLAWMDEQDVARAWISVPPPVYRQHLGEAASREWAGRLNDGLTAIASRYQDRLAPLYHLPSEHPALAAQLAREAGASRYALCAGGETNLVFSDPGFDPLWSELDAAEAFVFLHPGRCCDGRLGRFYLENLLGNPHETSVTVAHLLFGGVLTRYPRIRFCLAHGGGTAPMMAGRWQHGFAMALPELRGMGEEGPAALLRRFYADCLTHDQAALSCSVAAFGSDHMLFGSDWPFLMGLADPGGYLSALQGSIGAQIRGATPDASGPETIGQAKLSGIFP